MTTHPPPSSPSRDRAIRREALGAVCLIVGAGVILAVAFRIDPLLGFALLGGLLCGVGVALGRG
ncbi:hypothetical protein [Micromonospora haikouensis]|uniref:hypothetical protein n=1 Tax=Micromonospora haikouensis TaxID=686309 RepID=UPI003D713683